MKLDWLELLVVCATFFILGRYIGPCPQTALVINRELAQEVRKQADVLNKLLATASQRGILSGLLIEGSEILEFTCHGVKMMDPKINVEFFEKLLRRDY